MSASENVAPDVATNPRMLRRDVHGKFRRGFRDPNAARSLSLRNNMNRVRYPWATFWKRRALRREDRWILPLLAQYRDGLVSDKGGPANMSEAELRMIELAQLARGCTLLVLSAAKDGGLVAARKGPDLPSALGRFMQVEASCLKTLGLRRRPREVALSSYLRRPADEPPPAP